MSTTVGSAVSASSFGATTSSTSTATTKATGTLDKDDFLKILMTQLKYQDPMSPADPSQFMSQLSQLSQVEQLQNIAGSLEDIKSITQQGSSSQWLSAIGKKIHVEDSYLSQGDEIYITPQSDYDKVTLTLKSLSDGSTKEVSFSSSDALRYTSDSSDTLLAGATATKDGKSVNCTLNAFRTVRGIESGDAGMLMVTGDGKTYAASSIKLIKE